MSICLLFTSTSGTEEEKGGGSSCDQGTAPGGAEAGYEMEGGSGRKGGCGRETPPAGTGTEQYEVGRLS